MHHAQLGDRVRIQYRRLPEHGSVVDDGPAVDAGSTGEGAEPHRKPPATKVLEFTVGSGDVLPGISLGVVEMAPGDYKQLTLSPHEAYGLVKNRLIREIPRSRFPKHQLFHLGQRLTAISKVSRRRRRVRVVEIKPHGVVVDGNHRLAGKTIEMAITLVSVDSSSDANKRRPQFDLGGEG